MWPVGAGLDLILILIIINTYNNKDNIIDEIKIIILMRQKISIC